MANIHPYGCFTHAVVRAIPESFGKLSEGGDGVETDLAKAQRQMGVLTGTLRQKVGLQLIEIPADSELPESWRMEDMAVIQGDTALITRPFKQQRRSEVRDWLVRMQETLSSFTHPCTCVCVCVSGRGGAAGHERVGSDGGGDG